MHEHIADVARRFAKLGYLAIAPELFVRQGDAKATSDIGTLLATIISRCPTRRSWATSMRASPGRQANGGDTARLGITGFCWGGRITWLYAAHNPAVKAGVAWYGRLVGATTPLQPASDRRRRAPAARPCSASTAAPTPASRSTRSST